MVTDHKTLDKEEHHHHRRLSSAYIRSLVKEITSSRVKDPMNVSDPSRDGVGLSLTTQQPEKHKKQVRRRLHTSRPYQERLLNMAEARKEIVSALKYHRASMKQAREKKPLEPQPEQAPLLEPTPIPCFAPEAKIKYRRNQRIYPSFSRSWQVPRIAPPMVTDDLGFNLPDQPLGLNLNFHDFNPSSSSIYSSDCSSSLSSSSPPMPVHPVASTDLSGSSGGLHPAMDDKEMAEIRSIGEKHDMEWNDTMSLVTSAWWLKFLKTEGEEMEMMGEYNPFDEVMQFPPWFSPNESVGLQQQCYNSGDYAQIPALPCLDIGDFEGMDGEWLSHKDKD